MAVIRKCVVRDCRKKAHCKGFCASHYYRLTTYGDPKGGLKTYWGDAMAFAQSVSERDDDECIVWPYARSGRGYGVLRHAGKNALAHRLVCEKAHGKPKEGLLALHSCGNGRLGCVNPNHLRWGDKRDNYQDYLHHKVVGARPIGVSA